MNRDNWQRNEQQELNQAITLPETTQRYFILVHEKCTFAFDQLLR